ncbi:DUF4384 domain-containing protein [Candidatus Marithioploca araucensis]|uniref:DUF4384 domain-containing protein n=1 Tax=Candidatus Marithioploca araucensis TaxID=70273 RepID=A0ABT7VU56_9GAMM|nr:DUF4384 domain-containing protein [Candidatus Marithioploca araucensis]
MSDNISNEKGQKNNSENNSEKIFFNLFFIPKMKQWWASTFVKLIAGLGLIVLLFEFVVGSCEVSEIFGWSLCDKEISEVIGDKPPEKTIGDGHHKEIVVPPPETILQQAYRLFDNNSADLQVEILPSTLKVGESMYIRFKTNSDGYLLVLNINSQGALSQLIPRISQEKPSYLKLNKDQERIIPDPDDPYDLPRFVIEEPTGQEILIAILIKENELPLGIISALPFTSNMQIEQIKNPLNDLYGKLEKSVSKTWSSQVFEYDTFSSNKGD